VASDQKAHDRLTRAWQGASRFWQPRNDLYGRLLSFCLDLEHYRTSEGFTKDKRRIQPTTQRQLNLIRHKASLLLRQLPEFDTHPVQPMADSGAAEITGRVVRQIFHDPLKCYHDVRSRMVWSALAGGRGTMAIDWDQKYGVVFRFVDPRYLHIAPGSTFLHSPLNPFVIEQVPMRMSALEKMRKSGWNVPRTITPDNWKPDHGDGSQKDTSRIDTYSGDNNRDWIDAADPDDGIVTVLKCYYRDDPFDRKKKKVVDDDLRPDQWYWIDDATQYRQPFDPQSPVPPPSPHTGESMRLVTAKSHEMDYYEYPDGYFAVIAPFDGGKTVMFEGGWTEGALFPDSHLSAFPYMELGCYKHPLRRDGISDTEATKTLTIVDNSTFRSTWEQMSLAGGILMSKAGGLKDSEGNQFKFSGNPLDLAWVDDPMAAEMTKFFQAPGMNPSMPGMRSMIEQQWQHIGTGDIALGPERSRDIAVGTVNALQQQGDLPVQLHAQDLSLQESIGARVALDLCRAYMGDTVVSWITDSGDTAYATVRGADLTPMNVTVSANRDWRQQDVDRAQAIAQFFGQVQGMGLPPSVISILAKEAGMSQAAVSALAEAMAQPPAQEAPAEGQEGQPAPPMPGGPPQGGSPAQPMEGPQ
jgi:hypothetical protein